MRFAASIGVKDEVELIGPCIQHLRAIGVELILVWDGGSTDGTLDVLQNEERAGDVWVSHIDPSERNCNLRARALTVAQSVGAERCLFGDADEFLLTASGTLHDEPEVVDNDVLSVARFNVLVGGHQALLSPGSDGHSEVLVVARGIPDFHEHLAKHPDDSWILGEELPKLLAAPAAIAAFVPGAHRAELSPGGPWRCRDARRMLIAHLPFTSYERFRRKVENIQIELATRPEWFREGHGWQWLRWVRLLERGLLRAEFDRQVLSDAEIAGLRAQGVVSSTAALLAAGGGGDMTGGPVVPRRWSMAPDGAA